MRDAVVIIVMMVMNYQPCPRQSKTHVAMNPVDRAIWCQNTLQSLSYYVMSYPRDNAMSHVVRRESNLNEFVHQWDHWNRYIP